MKLIDTPIGKIPMPQFIEESINKLTIDEIIDYTINEERRTSFIPPFYLQFIIDSNKYSEYLNKRNK